MNCNINRLSLQRLIQKLRVIIWKYYYYKEHEIILAYIIILSKCARLKSETLFYFFINNNNEYSKYIMDSKPLLSYTSHYINKFSVPHTTF